MKANKEDLETVKELKCDKSDYDNLLDIQRVMMK